MKGFLKSLGFSKWEVATWGLIGAALACHDQHVRAQVKKEAANDVWDKAAEEIEKKATEKS